MATYQVPGFNRANQDELAAGCWAEGKSGYQILVEALADGWVQYRVKDAVGRVSNRQAPLLEFQQQHSDNGWLWHDKTPAPEELLLAG